MTTEQANQIPLQELLATLGHHPIKQQGHELVYYSPFHQEKTPCFRLNPSKNFWCDFGLTTKGGDLVSFAMEYSGHRATSDALEWISQTYMSTQPIVEQYLEKIGHTSKLKLLSRHALRSVRLCIYLQERRISLPIAQHHLQELHCYNSQTGKPFEALGFINQKTGFELRSKQFRITLGKKAISFIQGAKPSKCIHIFEGFMDFLTLLTAKEQLTPQSDVLVMNSSQIQEPAIQQIIRCFYRDVFLWLDNDKMGRQTLAAYQTRFASAGKQLYPMNHCYSGYKDVNACWQQTKTLSLKKTPHFKL